MKIQFKKNYESKRISPHCELEPAISDLKEKTLSLSFLVLTKRWSVIILFQKFLKTIKYAFTQNALDAFRFFASISTKLTISNLFC